MVLSPALPLADVNVKTPCFVGPLAPTLYLLGDPDVEDVVYLLRCKCQIVGGGYTWYIGRCPRCKLAVRMRQHKEGTASDFTAQNVPQYVEALYPAARDSVEAYAFFAVMETLPVAALSYGRLGGWTQTRPKPSQLCAQRLREEKRMMSDACLACGCSGHFADNKACPKYKKWPDSVPINCGHCNAIIDVTALGATRTRPPAPQSSKRPRGDPPPGPPLPPPPPAKRPRSGPPIIAPAVVPSQREYARARICGRDYTTLAWFAGKIVSESERNRVAVRCDANAVEFKNANANTMVNYGFAKANRPKELLPDRTNLSVEWLDTALKAARPPHKTMLVRKLRATSGRNVLWRVEDLVAHFAA